MTLMARIDQSACLGHGDCVHIAPNVFILEGDVAEQHAPGTEDELRAAARACPAGAITLVDEVDPEPRES